MGEPKTASQRKAASSRQKEHWSRCGRIADYLCKLDQQPVPASAADVNRWWKEIKQQVSEGVALAASHGDAVALDTVALVARGIFRLESERRTCDGLPGAGRDSPRMVTDLLDRCVTDR